MRNWKPTSMAALLAAGLLVVAGLSSTVTAHGSGHPGGPNKPVPSLHPKPSHEAKPSPKVHKLPDCKPAAATTAAPSAPTSGEAAPSSVVLSDESEAPLANLNKTNKTDAHGWVGKTGGRMIQVACSLDGLRNAAEKRADSYIRGLTRLAEKVTRSKVLTDAEKTALQGKISTLIASVNAVKTKLAAETTLEGLQADVTSLNALLKQDRALVKQVSLITAAEGVMAAGPKFDTLVTQLQALIAAAPDGEAKTQAQTLLTDLQAKVAEAKSLAAPIPAALLAYTPDQLVSGAGAQALKDARTTLKTAQADLRAARHDAHEIAELLGVKFPGKSPKP